MVCIFKIEKHDEVIKFTNLSESHYLIINQTPTGRKYKRSTLAIINPREFLVFDKMSYYPNNIQIEDLEFKFKRKD